MANLFGTFADTVKINGTAGVNKLAWADILTINGEVFTRQGQLPSCFDGPGTNTAGGGGATNFVF